MNTQDLAIVMVFGMPVLIVLVVALFAYMSHRNKMKLAESMVAHGQEVPKALIEGKKSASLPIAKLQASLIWMAVGLGSGLFFWLVDEPQIIGVCSIALLIGIAYMVVYLVMKKEAKNAPAEESDELEAEIKEIERM